MPRSSTQVSHFRTNVSFLRVGTRATCAALSLITFSHLASATPPPEVGWDYGDIDTGRSAALSGAQRAFSSSYGAMFSNPANMVSSRVYHVGALASIWPEAKRQTFGAAIVDSSTSSTRLAGGVAALWTVQDHNGVDRLASDLRLSLALPFSEQFRAGVTGRYLSLRQNGDGPLGPSLASGGLHDQSIVRGLAFDVGATLQPSKSNLALSVVGTGLNGGGNGFQPSAVGGGIGWGSQSFTIEGDASADFNTWDRTTTRYMLGAELLLAEAYPIRAGYRYDTGLSAHAASVGVGYISQVFSLEIGARHSFGDYSTTALVFSFAYHVESSGVGGSSEGD